MKVININCIFIFLLLFVNISSGQIQVSFEDVNQTPENNNFIRYPNSATDSTCSLGTNILIYQSDASGLFTLAVDGGSASLLTNNNTNELVYILKTVPLGVGSFDVEITGYNDAKTSLTINYECLDFEPANYNFVAVGKPYSDIFFGPVLMVRASGYPSYASLPSYINGLPLVAFSITSNTYLLLLSYYYQFMNQDLAGPLQIDLVFRKGTKSITNRNYYNELFYDTPNITLYPETFNKQITLIGKQMYPVITIESMSQDIQPFYLFSINGAYYRTPIKAIYQSCYTTTYLTTTFYNDGPDYSNPVSLGFYSQDKLRPYNVFNTQLNTIGVETTTFSTSQSGSALLSDNPFEPSLLDIGFAPNSLFLLNKYQFGLGGCSRMFDAPFGFLGAGLGADNSHYQVNFTAVRSAYNPSTTFSVFDSTIIVKDDSNQNSQDFNSPKVTSYEFIYLTNSKYIFRIGLSSPNCGLGYYSFDFSRDYKKIASYLVSGDIYTGVFEIPYDFDFELALFSNFVLYDLCGNSVQLEHDTYISSLPFVKFTVPFLEIINSFSVFDIMDVKFLHNNIDCSKQSVSNTIYFNYLNINKKAPFAFIILDQMNIITSNYYYTHEFYGQYNETLGMYQIEFVIPKNSKTGPFLFSIALGQKIQMNSNLLPESSQLIISKSNFDGIGPVFSKFEKIPLDGNKFGWSLNISDPINGFDNGTIIVRGSMDNSLYQFYLTSLNKVSGDINLGTWEIIINVDPRICVNQDYIITFVKLYDTGAQISLFELALPYPNQAQNPYIYANPFMNYFNDSMINKYSFICSDDTDLTPPNVDSFTSSVSSIDVGSLNREVTFTLESNDYDSGINIYSPPIVYLVGESLETSQCIMEVFAFDDSTATFKCTIEIPFAFSSTIGIIGVSFYGLLNNHGLYTGYTSIMLKSMSFDYKILTSFTNNIPYLIESSRASSKGGQFFVYGRQLIDIEKLTITDVITNLSNDYTTTLETHGSNIISISDMKPISNDFYVIVTSKDGTRSNRILVSPYFFLDYFPSQDDSTDICQGSTSTSSTSTSSTSSNDKPTPTNSPQQCLNNCNGPSNGKCIANQGCICYYPYIGKDCSDKVINSSKPEVDPEEPSVSIEVPDDKNSSVHYKSLISIYSLREMSINDKPVKEFIFSNNWIFTQDQSRNYYYSNITTGVNIETKVSVTLEWFNESKTIVFADQDLNMNPSTMKYTIEINSYPFSNDINYLQLVMSASFSSNSSDSCSLKEYGETSAGDNSNYMKIQIDNKSLYARFIRRGIADSKIRALSNVLLDNSMNSIEKSYLSQSYIGINIPQFEKNIIIDPDFSVILNSYDASSNSNSICKPKGLSGGKIAGIVIGSVAFVCVILVAVVYNMKKKNQGKQLANKLSNINKA